MDDRADRINILVTRLFAEYKSKFRENTLQDKFAWLQKAIVDGVCSEIDSLETKFRSEIQMLLRAIDKKANKRKPPQQYCECTPTYSCDGCMNGRGGPGDSGWSRKR